MCTSGCDWFRDDEFEYTRFGESFYLLHTNPANFESHVTSDNIVEDGNYFRCLNIHRKRQADEASSKIQACRDQCEDDAVCNFDCNNQSGTEVHEAWRDLMGVLDGTIRGNGSYPLLTTQASAMSDLVCFAANSLRELQNLAPLSCARIWSDMREDFIKEHTCTLKK